MHPDPRRGRLDILIAEDDPDDLFLLLRAFGRVAPHLVLESARDGIELCDRLAAMPIADLPQLVLLDLNLPRRDGREVLAQLRERGPAVPTVVLTTSVERDDHERARALGAIDVLTKPDDFRSLVDLVGAVIKRHLRAPGEQPP
jgi:CheY-like chemotaxis protein